MSSEVTMNTAERLYQRGIISYPRTETDSFANTFDLKGLIDMHRQSNTWGPYAVQLLDGGGFTMPRNGKSNDEAHPPIHPTKSVPLDSLQSNDEKAIYEFISRHFLACCSADATGSIDIINLL
jgi:DNA topoisomerase-3